MANYRGPKLNDEGLIFSVDVSQWKSYHSGSNPNIIYNLVDRTQTGSLQNGVTYTNDTLVFDGQDDIINFDTVSTNFQNSSQGTVDIWVKFDDVDSTFPGEYILIGLGNSALDEYFYVSLKNEYGAGGAYLRMIVISRTPSVKVWEIETLWYNFPFTNTQWYNITYTHDGTTNNQKLYVNSVPLTINTHYYYTSANNKDIWLDSFSIDSVRIGSLYKNGGPDYGEFSGSFSTIKIFDRPLEHKEIVTRYNTVKHRFGL